MAQIEEEKLGTSWSFGEMRENASLLAIESSIWRFHKEQTVTYFVSVSCL